MTSHDQIGYWILGFVNPMLGIFAAKNFILPPAFPPPPKRRVLQIDRQGSQFKRTLVFAVDV